MQKAWQQKRAIEAALTAPMLLHFCIFDCLSVQNNVLKVSLLFRNVAVHGVVSHLLSWLDRFFPLIAMTNSFAKPLRWVVDFLHRRKVAFLTKH